jgi:hypothetical protein
VLNLQCGRGLEVHTEHEAVVPDTGRGVHESIERHGEDHSEPMMRIDRIDVTPGLHQPPFDFSLKLWRGQIEREEKPIPEYYHATSKPSTPETIALFRRWKIANDRLNRVRDDNLIHETASQSGQVTQ